MSAGAGGNSRGSLLLAKNPVAKNAKVMPNAAPATNHAKRPIFAPSVGAGASCALIGPRCMLGDMPEACIGVMSRIGVM